MKGEPIEIAANHNVIRERRLFESLIEVGRRFDELLPDEDVTIAGRDVFYLGMPWQQNYYGLLRMDTGDIK